VGYRLDVGADIGQRRDYSAYAVVEHDTEHMLVRRINRLPLGTPFGEVVARLVQVVDDLIALKEPGTPPVWLKIDATAVGAPVAEDLRIALGGRDVIQTDVWFTGANGQDFRPIQTRRLSVPKMTMVANLQVALEKRKVKLPNTDIARETARELADFEIRRVGDHEAADARIGSHDDLVTALGLAILGEGRGSTSVYETRGVMVV
jgi:hypothetical protein